MLARLLICMLTLSAATASFAQQWEWVDNSQGSSNLAYTEDVAVDTIRDVVYAVGYVTGNPNFSEIPNGDYSDGDDGFVMKYDLNGNVLWGFLIGGDGDDRINGIEVDQTTGNIFITGYLEGNSGSNSTSLEGYTPGAASGVSGNNGGQDAFVAMYDSSGQLGWYELFGGPNMDRGMDIALNANGVYATGVYTNSVGITLFPLILALNNTLNNFVVGLDKSNGNHLWDAVQGSGADDYSVPAGSSEVIRTGITADENSVYSICYFAGSTYRVYDASDILVETYTDNNTSESDFVVTSYSAAGGYNWSTFYDNTNDELYGLDVTNDCDGVYISGNLYNGSVTPGGTVITSAYDNPILSKLNKSSGAEIWVKEFTSSFNKDDYFLGLDVDHYGNLFAFGRLRGTSLSSGADFNFTTGQSYSEPMLARYGTDGTFKSFEVLPSSALSWGTSLSTYKNEKYAVGGYYNISVNMGGASTGNTALNNAFVAFRDRQDPIEYVSALGGNIFCQSESSVIPILDVPLGGTFSGPSNVVFANTSTGEIDLSSSVPGGPYTITYTGFSAFCNTPVAEFQMYIVQDDDPSFTFAADTFCSNEVNPTPSFIATTGGTFSAPAGLVLADASSGEIDLAGSTPGTYWLVYTTNGTCSQSDSLEITIHSAPNADFGYALTTYCSGTGTISPSFVVNAGGTFSAPAGVVINSATGDIDLNTSTPGGPYTILHEINGTDCQGTATFDIVIFPSEDASFNYAETTLCGDAPNVFPTSVATPGGTFTTTSGLDIVDSMTGELDINSSTPGGPYMLYYTTSGGTCSSTDSLEFTIVAPVDPSFSYAQTNYCSNAGTILPDFVASPGGTFTSTAGLVLNAANGEIDLGLSSTGTYTIQYLTPSSVCQDSSTFTLTITQSEDASFAYSAGHFCQNESNPTPTISGTAGGAFSGSTGLSVISSSGEIDVVASVPGGPYWVYYTTPGPICSTTDSVQVYIEALPDPTFSYPQSAYCDTETDPVPTISGTTGGTFSANAGLVINPTTGVIDLSASTFGSYTVQYVVTNTYCSDTSTFNITVNETDNATFSYTAEHFCQSESDPVATISGTTGGTFSGPAQLVLNSSDGLIDVSASTVGGPYWVVYTTPGPLCPVSDSVQLYIEALPDPTFSYAQSSYCDNENDPIPTITGTTGGTFSASSGLVINPISGVIDISSSTPGSYTVQYVVTNTYCSDSSTFTITINTTEDASFTYEASNFCQNEPDPLPIVTGTLNGWFSGSTGLTLNSSNGEIDVSASVVGGPYWVVYTTPGPTCPVSDSVEVYIEAVPDPSFSYAQSAYCANETDPLPSTTGGVFSASAGLSINASSGIIDLSASTIGGPYPVQYLVTNAYCSDSTTFDITINPVDDASFNYEGVHFCQNGPDPIAINIVTPNGTFSGPSELVISSTNGEIDVSASTPGGPYWVVYSTVGAGTACPASDSVQVYIEEAPDPSFSYAQSAYCSNETNPLPSFVTSGGVFSATSGLVINSSSGEIDLAGSTAGGTYSVQYLVTNTYCSDSTTFDVTINQVQDASFSYVGNHFCKNEADPVPTISGTTGGTFSGSAGLVISTLGTIDVVASTAGGPYWVTYTTPGPICPTSDSIEVYIESAPDASFDYDQVSYCQGAGMTVLPNEVISGGMYSAPAGIVINSGTGVIDVDASTPGGPYTIERSLSNTYCEKTWTFEITILPQDDLTSVSFGSGNFCVIDGNQTPAINGLTGGTFTGPSSIDFVNTTTGEFAPSNSTPGGPYLIQYITPGTCPDSLELSISIFDVVTAYAGEDQELYFTFNSTLDADPPVNGIGEWATLSTATFDDLVDPTTDVFNLELGENVFVWTVTNGVCPAVSDEMIIEVRDIFIPQAVTPNGDGKNDFFEVLAPEESTCFIQIFNRWGQLVYENSDYENDWNGQNSKGEELMADTYFYTIVIDDSLTYNGFFVLKK